MSRLAKDALLHVFMALMLDLSREGKVVSQSIQQQLDAFISSCPSTKGYVVPRPLLKQGAACDDAWGLQR